ncbi:initiation factor 2 subunit family, putative [Plasmodium ovale curtisi]|uniref:Translation initiation factor eIF2B subunit delta n=1 Tax=Plasmodium ovale curtisi TaxID=864141 RepID=A0A1A8W8X6_PLAOA|nr:initiation factor 2 subunit family, putative [Plasmodium ovale curtisi]SBS88154.1 initiation factor 2 subunit family, putative [Plasmodium ovale curtisi]
MDDKSYLTFAKRKKKRVSGTINKEKFKKSFLKSEKYVRVSTLNKNISKKTFLHTLFKGFIKPYNERNTAFYSILCIINNIYKCHYFTEHRCLICKPLHENTSKLEEENLHYCSSDGDDNSPTFPFNIYYNFKKINLIELGKAKNFHTNGRSGGDVSVSPCAVKKYAKGSDTTCRDSEKNKEGSEREKKKVKKEEVQNEKREGTIFEENKNIMLSESVKSSVSNNKTKLSVSITKQNISVCETQPFSTCPIQNFLNGKFNFANAQKYNFLSHDKIDNVVDVYNFDVYDKINIYDKILLDLNQNEIHPTVLRTGIFFNKYMNTSHNHRNVDLLIALKSFIKDYTLPPYEPINRHMKIVIDKEINYIIMCKKHSISMGEVIRWFKHMITEHIGKSILEETKEIIINNINNYIRTKIVVPSIHISNYISENIIDNNDILLIYTFDYDIYLSIVKAKKKGKNFQIILVDSEPYKNSYNIKLYTKLGILVTYTLISGLFYNIKKCTKVLLGIDAIIHNSVYGYVGTSIICMMSSINNVQVYIVCETYKISNKIIIDSFSMNNINNNLDIYDYIYMHHYHNATPHKSVFKKDKYVDHSITFSKKLNNFIESYSDIKSNSILFSNVNSAGSRTPPILSPRITYSPVQPKRSNSPKRTCDIEVAIAATDANVSFLIETEEAEKPNNTVTKSGCTLQSNNDVPLFVKNCKEEKRDTVILKESHYETIKINERKEEKSSVRINEKIVSSNHVKEVNSSTVVSTKGILKHPINLSQGSKNESENISHQNNKQNYTNLSNDSKNINKKNKVFFNLKSDKTFYEKNSYSVNFKNCFDTPSNNMNAQMKQNQGEEDKICCNTICDSICNSIGNINIKNVCTDKHYGTNLFSSVLSHIDKINSNSDKSFYVANICSDVTPLKYISYIVTESNDAYVSTFLHTAYFHQTCLGVKHLEDKNNVEIGKANSTSFSSNNPIL